MFLLISIVQFLKVYKLNHRQQMNDGVNMFVSCWFWAVYVYLPLAVR